MAELCDAGYDEPSIRHLAMEPRYVTNLTAPGPCPDWRKPPDESSRQFAAYAEGGIR